MKKVLVVVSSRDGVSKSFFDSVKSISGIIGFVESVGITDVALARNVALTEAYSVSNDADIILMLDDDMLIDVSVINELVNRTYKIPLSVNYCDREGRPTHSYLDGVTVSGLGCLTIPINNFKNLYNGSKSFNVRDKEIKEITCSSCHIFGVKYIWLSEDYYLCMRLGGVEIQQDLRLGHIKKFPIFPKEI